GNRNGFFYVLDRVTGKVLLAEPFVKKITWASGIGPDGRPKLLPGNEPTVEGQLVCPAVAGAANWPSTAYNPATGLYYMFAEESCNIYTKNDQWWEAGKSFYGGGTRRPPGDNVSGKYRTWAEGFWQAASWPQPADSSSMETATAPSSQPTRRTVSCCGTSTPAR